LGRTNSITRSRRACAGPINPMEAATLLAWKCADWVQSGDLRTAGRLPSRARRTAPRTRKVTLA